MADARRGSHYGARSGNPVFATDAATAQYYDQRAAEYDEWYHGTGLFEHRERPGWQEDVDGLLACIGALPERVTVDIACGTGFLTQHIRGLVVGVDLSPRMLGIAGSRVAGTTFLEADALALPFGPGSFQRAFTGHFYGHLPEPERSRFLWEVRRVAYQLVVVDAAARPDAPADGWQERVLNDGSRHRVYKRYFTAQGLANEIHGTVLYAGSYFVAARTVFEDAERPGAKHE